MIEYNTCDKCKTKEDTTELVWITAEDFTPRPGEVLPDHVYHTYDALCELCYLSEVQKQDQLEGARRLHNHINE